MTVIDYFFGRSGMGEFESTICKAWKIADSANCMRLENAFPDHFPLARMYGAGDFREYASREDLLKALKGKIVLMNEWGKRVEAVLLPWSEIKKRLTLDLATFKPRGFRVSDRNFGSFEDPDTGKEVDCLSFMDHRRSGNNLWYVTTEKLEDLVD